MESIQIRELISCAHVHNRLPSLCVNLIIPALSERNNFAIQRADIEGEGIGGKRQLMGNKREFHLNNTHWRISMFCPQCSVRINHAFIGVFRLANFSFRSLQINRAEFITGIRLIGDIYSEVIIVSIPREHDNIGVRCIHSRFIFRNIRQSDLLSASIERLRKCHRHRTINGAAVTATVNIGRATNKNITDSITSNVIPNRIQLNRFILVKRNTRRLNCDHHIARISLKQIWTIFFDTIFSTRRPIRPRNTIRTVCIHGPSQKGIRAR